MADAQVAAGDDVKKSWKIGFKKFVRPTWDLWKKQERRAREKRNGQYIWL